MCWRRRCGALDEITANLFSAEGSPSGRAHDAIEMLRRVEDDVSK